MLLEGLSNDDDDAKPTPSEKMNLCFTNTIRDCLDLFGTPMALKVC